MRLKRILIPGLLASGLALPGLAVALGLGRLTVQSALGQPLVARIELTSATKDELDSLAARIAEPALYRQNNLTYQGVLSRSRVVLERNPNGQSYLTVTTQGVMTEPYLDLMIELNWASGRIVREYTFLLDPPGVNATPVDPTTPARLGTAPVATPAAPPRSSATPTTAAPTTSAPPTAAAPSLAAAPATMPAPAVPSAPRAAAPRAAAASDTYTVKRGDTLSKIAAEFKPANVTLEQMLVAMFKQNQGAFDGNINRLRAGAILNVPSMNEVAATEPGDASRVVKVHANDWNSYRNRVASSLPQSDAGATRGSGGQIGTVVEDKTPAAAPGRDQLRVSRAADGGAGAGATEETIARNKQIKEAQDRIAELEKTVRELQRAAELKSQTLAMLQAQAEAGKSGAQKSSVPVPTTEPKPPEAKTPDTTAKGAATSVPVGAEPASSSKVADAGKPPAESAKTETAKTAPAAGVPVASKADDTAATKSAAKAEEAAKPAPKAPAKAEAAKPEPSFLDDLMTSTPTWAIGAGALALLGGIAALLAARRRKAPAYEETMASDTDLRSSTVFGQTGGGVVNTGENSLSSEFSREGLGSIDTDEVDPIAEAEVYLAYGRDAQAEEILKDALKKDPHRQEVYLKLLEIHAQHNKPSAFDAVAAELQNVSHGEGEVWEKAVALGRQLDPANPMFATEAAHATEAGAQSMSLGDTQRFSVPPDLTPDAVQVPPIAGNDARDNRFQSARADAGGLGHDLDFHLEPEKPSAVRVAAPAAVAAAAAGRAGNATKSEGPGSLDTLDFALDEHAVKFEDPTPSVVDGHWHDSATKLDLAKAYHEMGDVEGAREILREVLAEGDDEQKTEARTLIAKLG